MIELLASFGWVFEFIGFALLTISAILFVGAGFAYCLEMWRR